MFFCGIPSFTFADSQGKIGFVISIDRIKEWLGTVLKSGVPNNTEQMCASFIASNLNFTDDNLDESTKYPRILGKFAAVEILLSRSEHEKVIPHIEFILNKRPRSALAYHYLGNAFLGLKRYVDAVVSSELLLPMTHEESQHWVISESHLLNSADITRRSNVLKRSSTEVKILQNCAQLSPT